MSAPTILSDGAAQAARLCTMALLAGSVDEARDWATEYAAHRDGKLTPDERDARATAVWERLTPNAGQTAAAEPGSVER